jgi:hypothetical protein
MVTTEAVTVKTDSDLVTCAIVRDDLGEWWVTRTRHSGFECNCPEAGMCSHISALAQTVGR